MSSQDEGARTEAVAVLNEMLDDPEPGTRRWAAHLLAWSGRADGKVVALVAPGRYGSVPGKGSAKPISEIRVFDAEGNPLSAWPLSFTAGDPISFGTGMDSSKNSSP